MDGSTLLKLLLDSEGLNPTSFSRDKLHNIGLQSGIQRFINGEITEPRKSTLEPIAAYFAIPIQAFYDEDLAEAVAIKRNLYLPSNSSLKVIESLSSTNDIDTVDINLFEIHIQPGKGCIPTFKQTAESRTMKYKRKWFEDNSINPKRAISLLVRDNSMEPFLFNGDSVLVNLDEIRIIDGKVYALNTKEDGLLIKRIYKKLGGGLILHSDNPNHLPKDEELDEAFVSENIYIIGRVRDKSGSGGL